MTLPRQCERQVDVRRTLMWNAVTIPVAVICPHFAMPGSPYCERHQPMSNTNPERTCHADRTP